MACFLVSATEAVVVTAIEKGMGTKAAKDSEAADDTAFKVPIRSKLKWLSNMLWGGSVLLAFEHVWHGEVVPWFPFLTAMNDPGDTAEMLHEMATVGVAMAVLITLVWVGMCLTADAIAKRTGGKMQKNTKA